MIHSARHSPGSCLLQLPDHPYGPFNFRSSVPNFVGHPVGNPTSRLLHLVGTSRPLDQFLSYPLHPHQALDHSPRPGHSLFRLLARALPQPTSFVRAQSESQSPLSTQTLTKPPESPAGLSRNLAEQGCITVQGYSALSSKH
ncbi:hypothetical protein M0R45_001001 [Rubus argutus]|uniref:Uncharacterized protein n=1 Tax=Rubus argutus TaxID=59490 RepID=A0AAW1VMR7_RUBAR